MTGSLSTITKKNDKAKKSLAFQTKTPVELSPVPVETLKNMEKGSPYFYFK